MKGFLQREMQGKKIHAQKSSHHHLKMSSIGRERVQKSSKHHHKIILPEHNILPEPNINFSINDMYYVNAPLVKYNFM